MANEPVKVGYNDELDPLVELLSAVKRPGDFYATGSLDVPMPKLEIDPVGVVGFPLPPVQAAELVQHSEAAPYGRGEETIIDPKVRKVWQFPVNRVRLGGKSWPQTLDTLVAQVAGQLGCNASEVSAELYKVLLYDVGAFFVSHRDTEKAKGMFGTLVVVLPSFHQGGELVVRHAGREVSLDLSTKEASQINYAAFYADCEHEVRPVTQGNRLCLIYNLIQKAVRKKALVAPDYEREISGAATLLKGWSELPGTAPKIAYLLEHQYTPAALSFAGLKNADAALGKVLAQAAERAGFAVHLGIVHIEESGAAEITYEPSYTRWGRRRRYYEPEESEDEADESGDEDFEIVEVSDSNQYISDWVNIRDEKVDFGQIPLGVGELLPPGALDGEAPDEKRVTEATGNEGASFDRAFHRAALVLWRLDRYPEVLLQGGVSAAIPYFRERTQAWVKAGKPATGPDSKEQLASLAGLLVDRWGPAAAAGSSYYYYSRSKPADRAGLLKQLLLLKDAQLVKRFAESIVLKEYDGSENVSLVAAAPILGVAQTKKIFSKLIEANLPFFPNACVNLLHHLANAQAEKSEGTWLAACLEMAGTLVQLLPKIGTLAKNYGDPDYFRAQSAKPLDPDFVVELFETLQCLKSHDLSESAAAGIAARSEVFVPDELIVPALSKLRTTQTRDSAGDRHLVSLWRHAAEYLLARSETSPEEPSDWAQPAQIKCRCQDCRELETFARNPREQVHRFRVAKERRRHLHSTIETHGLDMTHETERVGSPQTLVCTKTRRAFQKRCEQYAKDLKSFKILETLGNQLPKSEQPWLARVREAIRRGQEEA
jgi:hypothetical protein